MITTWSSGSADAHMPEVLLVELAVLVRRHPWWRARARLTLALLEQLGVQPPAQVLDAGCGWGVTLDALERRGYRPTGLDVSRQALAGLEQERDGRALIEADLTRPLPADPPAFDAVLALDVIEHLDDDRGAVEQLGRLVRPGGLVVVSVPALPELYSEFDAIQGHRRRYRPETLRAAFADTGLELDRIFWWGGWLLPLLRHQRGRHGAAVGEPAAQSYRRHLRLPPWPGPWVLRGGFALEHARALRQRLKRGSSLFAVARRPGTPAR